jgi:hypothetical protein
LRVRGKWGANLPRAVIEHQAAVAQVTFGQRQFREPRRGFRQEAVEVKLFRHAEHGGDMTVRQRALDAQIVDGQRHRFVLQDTAEGLDLGVRPIGEIGDGARPDLAAIAIAFAQQYAGGDERLGMRATYMRH